MRASQGNLALHGSTFLLWAALAASGVFWGLRLSAGSASTPVAAPGGGASAAIDASAVARLLGAAPAQAGAAPTLASRFSLLGVVAGRSSEGAALISVDGKPARPYRVGATVDEGLVLQSVRARQALLGPAADAPASLTLELPPPKRVESRAEPRPLVSPGPRLPVPTQNPTDGRNDAVGVRTQND